MLAKLFVKVLGRAGGILGFALFFGAGPAWALTPTEVDKLLAGDGAAYGGFGQSVSVDGDTALIGAPGDDDNGANSGSAYVFTRSGSVWAEQAKLLASDGAAYKYFGVSVAVDGDTAVIGTFRDSAYVFTRSGGVWAEQAKLLASDGAPDDQFGISVAVDGDTAVIGAKRDDDNGYRSGSAYVFNRNGGVWVEQAKLLASDGTTYEEFGRSVAVDGDTAVIGCEFDRDNGFVSGSAYVFNRNGGVWVEQAKLLASDGAPYSWFGRSVAVDGDTVVIGASSGGLIEKTGYCWMYDSGSAHVFNRDGGVWAEQAKLLPSDSAPYTFITSVAVDGDTVVIGAFDSNENCVNDSGSAYVFTRSGGVWAEQAKLLASDGAPDDQFGISVAVDGDTALIGANGDDDNGVASGSAYVFTLGLADRDGDGIPDADDSCPDEDAAGLDADSDGCLDDAAGLIDLIYNLPPDALEPEVVNSLTQKVSNATKQATNENICAAVNMLGAFQNQVEAQRGHKIADAEATLLITYSNNLITQFLQQLPPGTTCN